MIPSELVLPGPPAPSFERLAEVFVAEYTAPGDMVLDPFAGSGSTMAVARRLGRRGLGVEVVPELAAGIRKRLGDEAVVAGDSRRIESLHLPPADLVMTSPPFMTRTDHEQNPLSGYQTLDGDYAAYIPELAAITVALARIVRPGGRVVLNVWNFHHGGEFTALADDLEAALKGILDLEQRVQACWDDNADTPDDDICLVYRTGSAATRS